MPDINVFAVIAATVSSFVLGGLWYSPVLFGGVWSREAGVADKGAGHPAIVFGIGFLLSLIAATVFAMFLGPDPALKFAIGAGFAAGLFWVATSFGINYLFANRGLKMWLIDGGYHTLQFGLYGLILGLWH